LALQTALNMPLEERRARHQQMISAVRKHDIHNWYRTFVRDLTGEQLLPRFAPSAGQCDVRSARSLL
jgi:trehalose-6-phosphate synthase